MAIQILCSAFLGFAWSQIQSENAPENFAKSKILDITMQVDSSINALWQDRLNSLQHGLSIALNSNAAAGVPLEISTPIEDDTSEVIEPEILNKSKQDDSGIGFKLQNNSNKKTNKKCAYCGKDISKKKHWNAKYCNDDCRILFWENKNKTKLRYKRK